MRRKFLVGGGDRDRRGIAFRHLLGEGWPAHRTDPWDEAVARTAQQFGNDFGHAQQGIVLDAFSRADEQHLRTKVRQHRLKHAAGVMRRHDAYDNLRAVQRLLEAVGGAGRFPVSRRPAGTGRSRGVRGCSRTPRAHAPTTARGASVCGPAQWRLPCPTRPRQ